MATQTRVELLDDVDGSTAEETVEFALDGVSYEIDLSSDNAEALRDALNTYVECGRRMGGRQKQRAGSLKRTILAAQRAPLSVAERHAIQRFAEANGYKAPAARGRIGAEVLKAWEDAGRPS